MRGSVDSTEPLEWGRTYTQRSERESKSRKDRDWLHAGKVLSCHTC